MVKATFQRPASLVLNLNALGMASAKNIKTCGLSATMRFDLLRITSTKHKKIWNILLNVLFYDEITRSPKDQSERRIFFSFNHKIDWSKRQFFWEMQAIEHLRVQRFLTSCRKQICCPRLHVDNREVDFSFTSKYQKHERVGGKLCLRHRDRKRSFWRGQTKYRRKRNVFCSWSVSHVGTVLNVALLRCSFQNQDKFEPRLQFSTGPLLVWWSWKILKGHQYSVSVRRKFEQVPEHFLTYSKTRVSKAMHWKSMLRMDSRFVYGHSKRKKKKRDIFVFMSSQGREALRLKVRAWNVTLSRTSARHCRDAWPGTGSDAYDRRRLFGRTFRRVATVRTPLASGHSTTAAAIKSRPTRHPTKKKRERIEHPNH